MKSPCKICANEKRPQIDLDHIRGVSAGTIARRHDVSRYLLDRHIRQGHVSELLRLTQEHAELKTSADIRREIEKIYHENQDIKQRMLEASNKFEKDNDTRSLMVTLREVVNVNDKILDVLRIYVELTPPPQSAIDIAQAARDLYGISASEIALLDKDVQPALPAAEDEKAPQVAPRPEPKAAPAPQAAPKPTESMAARYKKTSASLDAPAQNQGHWVASHDPNIEEKIRRATPVRNLYDEAVSRAHAEGRRLEVGEASPHMLGTDVDFNRPKPEALPPVPQSIYLGGDGGRCRCPAPGCPYEGLLSNQRGYEAHWRAAHGIK